MMKNNKSKDCHKYLIKKNAKYSADGKAKGNWAELAFTPGGEMSCPQGCGCLVLAGFQCGGKS